MRYDQISEPEFVQPYFNTNHIKGKITAPLNTSIIGVMKFKLKINDKPHRMKHFWKMMEFCINTSREGQTQKNQNHLYEVILNNPNFLEVNGLSEKSGTIITSQPEAKLGVPNRANLLS